MKNFWDKGAAKNPYHWVMTGKENWDKDEYYAEGKKHVEELIVPFLERCNLSLEDCQQKTFLDVGCGTGRMTVFLANLFSRVIGTDVSEKMIDQAKIDHKDIQIQFYVTSGTDLHCVTDESVDVAFSYAAYQHISKKSIVIKNVQELYRVLKPGGVAKIEVRGSPGNPPGKVLWFRGLERFYVAIVLWRNWLPIPFIRFYTPLYGACFTEKEYYFLLQSIGFTSTEVYTQGIRHLWAEIQK